VVFKQRKEHITWAKLCLELRYRVRVTSDILLLEAKVVHKVSVRKIGQERNFLRFTTVA